MFVRQPLRFPEKIKTFAYEAQDLRTAMRVIESVAARGNATMILAALRMNDDVVAKAVRAGAPITRTMHQKEGQYSYFEEVPRHLFGNDFDCNDRVEGYPEGYDDWCERQGLNVFTDPEGAVRAVVDEFFPAVFKTTSYFYQLSAGAGIGKDGELCPWRVKFHAFFWTTTPVLPSTVKEWINAHNEMFKRKYGKHAIDPAFYTVVQPHFIAAQFIGATDPLDGKRFGFIGGETDTITIEKGQAELREIDDHGKRLKTTVSVPGYFVGTGPARTFLPRSKNGTRRDYGHWPREWRECLARHGEQGSGHDSLKYATFELAKEIATQDISRFNSSSIEPFRAEFNAEINASYRSTSEKSELCAEVGRYFEGAVGWVRARYEANEARKHLVKPPTYPDRCVPLDDAVQALRNGVRDWLKDAKRCAENRAFMKEEFETVKAEAEELLVKDPSGKLSKARWQQIRLRLWCSTPQVWAVDAGVGKTHITVDEFLEPGYYDTYRFFSLCRTRIRRTSCVTNISSAQQGVASPMRA